uniref:Uncharacterized protein n=1 Tax=Arundo donax TaxID=35708 RepID=A0A0A9DLX7_ARUDO
MIMDSAVRIASDVPVIVTFLSDVLGMKSPLSEILILAPLACICKQRVPLILVQNQCISAKGSNSL